LARREVAGVSGNAGVVTDPHAQRAGSGVDGVGARVGQLCEGATGAEGDEGGAAHGGRDEDDLLHGVSCRCHRHSTVPRRPRDRRTTPTLRLRPPSDILRTVDCGTGTVSSVTSDTLDAATPSLRVSTQEPSHRRDLLPSVPQRGHNLMIMTVFKASSMAIL